MAENEELILSVRLDDQASAQLARIKASLADIGGDGPGGIGRLRRQAADTGAGVKQMGAEISNVARVAGFAGGVIGGITVELGRMGLELASRATDFQKYADSLVAMSQRAREAATSTAQLRANIQVFRESGIDAERATRNLQGFSAAIADLSRVNSELRQKLLGGARGAEVQQIQQRIQQIMSVDRETAMNIVKQWGEQLAQEYAERGQPELGRQIQKQLYQMFGAPDLGDVRRAFDQVTQWQKDLQELRAKDAAEYQTQLERYKAGWVSIGETISSIILPTSTMKMLADYAQSIAKWFEEAWGRKPPSTFEDRFGKWPEPGAAPQPGATTPQRFMGGQTGGGGRFRPDMGWVEGLSGEASTNIEDRREQTTEIERNTEELKRLNDFLQGAAIGGAPSGALGFLGTQMGGLAPGYGGGTGVAGPLGGPMGGLGGGGGAPAPGGGGGAPAPGGGGGAPAPGGGGGAPAPGGGGGAPAPGGGLRMPTSPQEAPQTLEEATKGGFLRGGGGGGGGVTDALLDAIEKQEGSNRPGTVGYDQNNPGNIKWGPFAKRMGAIGSGRGGHAIFPDRTTGRAALRSLLEGKGRGQSLSQIGRWYAEGPQGGAHWARGVARAAGVGTDYVPSQGGGAGGGAAPGMTTEQVRRAVEGGPPTTGAGPQPQGDQRVVDATGRAARQFPAFGKDGPKAIITHHTGGATLQSAIAALNQKGLGYNYIVDKDGTVHQFVPEGRRGAHIRPGWGDVGKGLTNDNTIGISAVGVDERDLTPAQIEAMRNLARRLGIKFKIPPSRVFGHGQVNPGHRTQSEGATTYKWAQQQQQWDQGPVSKDPGDIPPPPPHPLLGPRPPQRPERLAEILDAERLDRAATQRVDVNGTGKISVDVKAPNGTKVAATGGGLFKKTEVARQTQMQPAQEGPNVEE
jgi:hypothetical protein